MTNLDVLTPQDSGAWMRALDRCAPFDFYHLPSYHALAQEAGEGAGHLFVYSEDAYTIALPLSSCGLDRDLFDEDLCDATSVYGYAGPVCSHQEMPEHVVQNFQSALAERLTNMRVVTVFSRLHPFFTQRCVLNGLGECQRSRTVAIDLGLPAAVQRSQYRKACKEGINKLRRAGVTVVHDLDGSYLSDFIRIYRETMTRVEAADRYLFSCTYFQRLWETLGSRIHLFVCLQEGQAVCAGLFTACHGIMQYHLGGTLNDALKLAPMRLLVDEARLWGNSQGLKALHLGGGLTSDPDDSLLHFKTGFSDQTREFATWRWILDQDAHDRLCEAKSRWNDRRHHVECSNGNFFPAYRAPTMPRFLEPPHLAFGELAREAARVAIGETS